MGEPKVEKRYQMLVDADPEESRAMCELRKEANCENVTCTGNNTQASAT